MVCGQSLIQTTATRRRMYVQERYNKSNPQQAAQKATVLTLPFPCSGPYILM